MHSLIPSSVLPANVKPTETSSLQTIFLPLAVNICLNPQTFALGTAGPTNVCVHPISIKAYSNRPSASVFTFGVGTPSTTPGSLLALTMPPAPFLFPAKLQFPAMWPDLLHA